MLLKSPRCKASWLAGALCMLLGVACGGDPASSAGGPTSDGSTTASGVGGTGAAGPTTSAEASTGGTSGSTVSSAVTAASTGSTSTSASATSGSANTTDADSTATSGVAMGGSGGSGDTTTEGAGGTFTQTSGGGATSNTESATSTTGANTTGGDGFVSVPFILGADISFIQEEEDKGIVFVDGGQQKEFIQILTDHGFNFVRLRLFHTPSNGYAAGRAEAYCDQAHTIEMAQRVKAAGMGLLLDFHYSDTWADPDDQHKPAAWESLNFSQLVTAVHDYTRDTLLAFQAAGVLPEMVQVGNEITPGMLHPDGHTYDPENWDQLAQLLTAGLSAVKEVDSRIQTMLHLDRGGDNETTVWWVGEALERGVQFDILGQSAYSAFHGGPSVWQANFDDLVTRYPDLDFVIAEYNGDKRAANDIMRNLPNGRGLGTFFWEPTANGEWGDSMVTWSGATATMKASDLAIYDQIADDYGLR